MPSDSSWARFSMGMSAGALRRLGRFNVPVYRLTRGRLMGRIGRAPVLLLTTTGRHSGEPRTSPVLFGREGEDLVVVGSNAGNSRPPAWALNLRADPEAEVQIRGSSHRVRARVAEGAEHGRIWARINDEYAGFADYALRTEREIPIFVLEPA
ncbi:nitroreductase family deazaflavin-dependent oxidoreductase [soil metagenome]